jgi:predicted dehydrogenase
MKLSPFWSPRLSRRKFFFLSGALAAAGGAGYWFGRKPVHLGLIGAGAQGRYLAHKVSHSWWFGGWFGQIMAIADVDRGHALAVQAECCGGAEIYQDYRRVLERDDVEAVLIATPDHWHTRIAVHAMRAGKAVYCEKPISLTVAEGQLLVRTVRETGSVFLGGTLQRSDRRFRTACELVRNGRLGTLRQVTVTLPQRWQGESAGPFATGTPPAELNWDFWLGQAPHVPYCKERCHGSFRRWYEYAGGQMADWGAHHIDIVHWALGAEAPLTLEGHGRMPAVPNGYNTPIEFTVDMRYPMDVHVLVRTDPDEAGNGIRFEGDAGWIFVSRGKLEGPAIDELAHRPLPPAAIRLHESSPAGSSTQTHHLIHFFRCLREGESPISDVESQHRSASACHLANIALRLGRKLTWDATREQFPDDSQANAMLRRSQRAPYELPA